MRYPYFIRRPKLKFGDAERMADAMAKVGMPLMPWQREFLNQLERSKEK